MIEARGITRVYLGRGGLLDRAPVHALRGVDLAVPARGTVCLIGESGSGKTTLGRILCGLDTFDHGELVIAGQPMARLRRRQRAAWFRRVQLIQQDPYAVLNPARRVGDILGAPLALRQRQRREGRDWARRRRAELLEMVGLDPGSVLPCYPHILSGGMRQRVAIARALTVNPALLVADEAVSMIDVSLRLGIIRLFGELREQIGISLLFITHDAALARSAGQDGDLYVLYRGTVVEHGRTEHVLQHPVHPYTQCLLSAIPVMRGLEHPGPDRLEPVADPGGRQEPPGCRFEPRCPFAASDCRQQRPALSHSGATGQEHACLYPQPRAVLPVPVPGHES